MLRFSALMIGSKAAGFVLLMIAGTGGASTCHGQSTGGDRSETVAALPKIIHGLRHRGYHLVTVAQLVHDDPPPHNQPPPTPLSGVG